MNPAIALDSNVLGKLINPRPERVAACVSWFEEIVRAGYGIYVCEIIYYELCRELVRIESPAVQILNAFIRSREVTYLPITTPDVERAIQLWARVRRSGQATAHEHDLDVDVILAAQVLGIPDRQVVIATENVKHLGRLTRAMHWRDIQP